MDDFAASVARVREFRRRVAAGESLFTATTAVWPANGFGPHATRYRDEAAVLDAYLAEHPAPPAAG